MWLHNSSRHKIGANKRRFTNDFLRIPAHGNAKPYIENTVILHSAHPHALPGD